MKTTSQEEDLTGRRPHMKMTSQEHNLTGRRPHRKTTSQEDDLTGRQVKINGLASKYGLSLAQLSPIFLLILFIVDIETN